MKDTGSLQVLDMSNNSLTSVHGLDNCTNLRWLDISHNNITRLGKISACKPSLVMPGQGIVEIICQCSQLISERLFLIREIIQSSFFSLKCSVYFDARTGKSTPVTKYPLCQIIGLELNIVNFGAYYDHRSTKLVKLNFRLDCSCLQAKLLIY